MCSTSYGRSTLTLKQSGYLRALSLGAVPQAPLPQPGAQHGSGSGVAPRLGRPEQRPKRRRVRSPRRTPLDARSLGALLPENGACRQNADFVREQGPGRGREQSANAPREAQVRAAGGPLRALKCNVRRPPAGPKCNFGPAAESKICTSDAGTPSHQASAGALR